ncbi:Aspartic proteinase Asp1 [Hordeum vulgare]|nr:Aspartic proteinase Asp1 [Hordeum vulgare]
MSAMWSPIIGLLPILLPLASSSSHIKLPLGGKVYPEGNFYVTMNIGVPAKPYFLCIDTGSNLTWLGCQNQGCKNCKVKTVNTAISHILLHLHRNL